MTEQPPEVRFALLEAGQRRLESQVEEVDAKVDKLAGRLTGLLVAVVAAALALAANALVLVATLGGRP